MNEELLDDLQELEGGPDGAPEEKAETAKFDPEEFRREQRAQQATIESLKRELSETRQAQQYQREQSAPQAEPLKDPEGGWLEEIEQKGADAFKGRFTTKDDLDAAVRRMSESNQMSAAHSKLKSDFPDLFVPDSEFRNRVDVLLSNEYATPAQAQETKMWALEAASMKVKQEFEATDRLRTARTGAAGGYRPMNGSSGSGPSRPTALTARQRHAASELGVSEKAVLASVQSLAEDAR